MEHAVANTKQTGNADKIVPQRGSAPNAAPELHPALQLQQQAGNQAMQQLLRSGAIRAKLAISQPNDPEEQEADRTADRIMRSHAGVGAAAASCPCGTDEEGMCDECQQKAAGISRKATDSGPSHATHHALDTMKRSAGHPLDAATRGFFEPRFGRDFSNVRIHTDASAATSAQSIQAHAYVAGQDIFFDAGRYAPHTEVGKRLLAHELTHTVQQGQARVSGIDSTQSIAIGRVNDPMEAEAHGVARSVIHAPHRAPSVISADAQLTVRGHWYNDAWDAVSSAGEWAGDRVEAGASAAYQGAKYVGGRVEAGAEAAYNWTGDRLRGGVDWIKEHGLHLAREVFISILSSPARAMGSTAYRIVRATWTGFFDEIAVNSEQILDQISGRIGEFVHSPSELLMFLPSYWWGLLKGIVSPITGLIDLAKFAYHLMEIGAQVSRSAWRNRERLVADAKRLAKSMFSIGGHATTALRGMLEHPIDSIEGISKLLDMATGSAVAAAERGGHKIGAMFVKTSSLPIPDQAEIAGEVIGTVVVNVALVVFTEGIGDAILQIASRLGEVGEWLGTLGRGGQLAARAVQALVSVIADAGTMIADLEQLLARLLGVLLKPLEPLLREVGELLTGLRTFLRDLLGVTESAESTAGSAAARSLGAAEREGVPPAVDRPGAGTGDGAESQLPAGTRSTSPPTQIENPAAQDIGEAEWADDVGMAAIELDRPHAYQEFNRWIHDDPAREVGIFMDPESGEFIVVQGREMQVPVADVLAERGYGRNWSLVEHYHPGGDPFARLASPQDFEFMMYRQTQGIDPIGPVSTRIRWIDPAGGVERITTIGYNPGAAEPYFMEFTELDGSLARQSFRDPPWQPGSDFDAFMRARGVPMDAPPGPTSGGTPRTPTGPSAPPRPVPGSGPPPTVTADPGTVPEPRTAQTGGIRDIHEGRDALGERYTTIEGRAQTGMARRGPGGAPNYNREWSRQDLADNISAYMQRNSNLTQSVADAQASAFANNYEAAHLYGPGFGDEAAAGMSWAPREVNQELQNRFMEDFIRRLQREAAARSGTVEIAATSVLYDRETLASLGLRPNESFLQHADYRVEVQLPGREPMHVRVTVNADLPGPGAHGSITFYPPGIADRFLEFFR